MSRTVTLDRAAAIHDRAAAVDMLTLLCKAGRMDRHLWEAAHRLAVALHQPSHPSLPGRVTLTLTRRQRRALTAAVRVLDRRTERRH